MPNIKLTIQYDGTNYCGWQTQNSHQVTKSPSHQVPTIQGTIEKALYKIIKERVRVIGSGRTDAGVHALAQVANFRTTSRIKPGQIQRALNSSLPADIRIIDACRAAEGFQAQFRAKSKIYRYLILNSPYANPMLRNYVWHVHFRLDIALMRREISCLKGKHDFKSFCNSGSKTKSTVRTITKISLLANQKYLFWSGSDSGRLISLTLEADGFLYNMVRNIVGTLVDIGRGHLQKGDMSRILKARDRRSAGNLALAKGLYLCSVTY